MLIVRATCPITLEIMNEPVVDEFGHTYEKIAIERHMEIFMRSPLTNQAYCTYAGILNCFGARSGPMVVMNYAVVHAITEFWNLAVLAVKQPYFDPAPPLAARQRAPVTPQNRVPPAHTPRRNAPRSTRAPPPSPATPVLPRPMYPNQQRRRIPWLVDTNADSAYDTEDTEVDALISEGDVPEPILTSDDA